MAKRITTWQVGWRNRISQEVVSGDIEAQRLYAQARARAQVENIENLLTSIEAMRKQTGVDLHQVVMLRVVEIMEAVLATRALGPMASRAALAEATSELRQALGRGGE